MPSGDARLTKQRWLNFGAWLNEQRSRLGLTQAECAKKTGLSVTTWSRMENGISGTTFKQIPKIAETLWTDLAETYRQAGFAPPRQVLDDAARASVNELLVVGTRVGNETNTGSALSAQIELAKLNLNLHTIIEKQVQYNDIQREALALQRQTLELQSRMVSEIATIRREYLTEIISVQATNASNLASINGGVSSLRETLNEQSHSVKLLIDTFKNYVKQRLANAASSEIARARRSLHMEELSLLGSTRFLVVQSRNRSHD